MATDNLDYAYIHFYIHKSMKSIQKFDYKAIQIIQRFVSVMISVYQIIASPTETLSSATKFKETMNLQPNVCIKELHCVYVERLLLSQMFFSYIYTKSFKYQYVS